MGSYEDAQAVCKLIKSKINCTPRIGIICGSGLGTLAETVKDPVIIKYEEIKQFPKSTVVGHAGNLVFGKLGGKYVMVMQGRFHQYEGYEMSQVTLPVRVMKLLGVEYLIVTNAAGGLNPQYNVGDIVFIKDHINFPSLSGKNPLVGANDNRFGTRFPSMSNTYKKELRELARKISNEMNISSIVHEGIYFASCGPAYETPAEARMLRILGADLAGFSTAHETMVASHCGLNVFAMSLVTNIVIVEDESPRITNHEEVLETSAKRSETLKELVTRLVTELE
uniref:Purine nucleoside phosphorylase n=1 Tax=Schistocephalus solidus TaxID=70667 RepID=A0A0X3P6B0_SCHSO